MKRLAAPLLCASVMAAAALSAPAAAQPDDVAYPAAPLAELLGEMHALNYHCRTADQQTWRSRMQQMLDLEAPEAGAYRDRLTQRFNRGFNHYTPRSVRCGGEAEMQLQTLRARARALAENLRQNYTER